MKNTLRKWTAAALALLTLAGCGMVGYGECFSRCGGNIKEYWDYGAPADPTRGELWNTRVFDQTEKYTIFGFITMDRIGEPPGADKVNAQAYVPDVSAQQAQGSAWFSVTVGRDYVDPVTLRSKKGRIPSDAPLMPPGVYKLTAQASVVEKLTLSGKYYPFRSPPQSTTIVVEAGKWSILWNKVKVDESTEPITITVEFGQSGQDALPRLRQSGGSSFTPKFVIADPLPGSASSPPSIKTRTP